MTRAAPRGRLLWTVLLISAAVLGYEISLMRVLLVAGWHHFAFLVISVALLGFGASGTGLLMARTRVLRHGEPTLFGLALATAAAMPLALAVWRVIPAETRIVPVLLWRQVAWWVLSWAVLAVPFFLGAAAVGLALMLPHRRMGLVYGVNLLGSAGGALATPALMSVVPPAGLPVVTGAVALAGALGLARTRRSVGAAALVAAVTAGWLIAVPPAVRTDSFKYVSHLRRLETQGSVERVARVFGPRAVVEAYRGEALHDLPFVSVGPGAGAVLPPITVLLRDGHLAGSVLDVADADGAAVMDGTLMAFPYALIGPGPRVALLGEAGGANAWLAARHGATAIAVVQPDRNVVGVLRGALADAGGVVLSLPQVSVHTAEPREFVERPGPGFDLIQLSMMESSAAGSGGVGGLAEDHLFTVEGIAACLRRLRPDGVLAVTRGMQTPPRDNVRILATALEALRRCGATTPGRHVVIVRDYLAVCTVVRATRWEASDLERVRSVCRERQLTPVWFEGIEAGELNRPDALPEPPDGVGDWYHYAARRLTSPQPGRFLDEWVFDVRPPTDDRPFFGNFFRLSAVPALREAYGDLWLTRTELAFLFVLAAIVLVGAAGAAATLAPLPLLRAAVPGGRAATAGYFGCLGLGYLLLEMVCLSRLTFLLGDPILAAAVTIGGFLAFSGLGSLASERVRRPLRAAGPLLVAVAVLGLVWAVLPARLGPLAGALPVPVRSVLGLLLIAPPAVLMGFPMPLGLSRLSEAGRGAALLPWAWGTNGFASVLAAPLALAIAMTWGYLAVGVLAAILYLGAGALFRRLPAVTT